MNIVSLVTFMAGIVYLYLGYFGIKSDFRARIHQIFVLLCVACAWWAFCIAFMFPAADRQTAWFLLRLSSVGWCMGPPLILHFTIYLTVKRHTFVDGLIPFLIYIPGIFFTIVGTTVGLTSKMLVLKSFGWDNIAAADSPLYWAYVAYYLLCVGISIAMVMYWGYHSNSRREKGQARVLSVFSFLGLLFASGSETLLPVIGITSFPKIPVVMWLFWAYGMWYAISKYRFMIMTSQIAAAAIVSSITDMLVILDARGEIIVINEPTQNMLGYVPSELMHRPAGLIFASQYPINHLLEKIETKTLSTTKVELDYQTRSGEKIPVMLSCSAIRDSFDELTGIVLVAQDLRTTKQLEVQNAELEAIGNNLMEANLALQEKSTQIKNILNNVGQGFLSFGADLRIHDEYSRECDHILGRSAKNCTLSDLIYPNDEEQSDFLQTVLTKILTQNDKERNDLYLSLLPSEIEINRRCISLEYRLANNSLNDSHCIIVILTDITEKRLMEVKIEEEQHILRMLVKAIVYYDSFTECIEEFRYFADHGISEILDEKWGTGKKVNEIYRNVHTFKGNFSQFDTINIVVKMHKLETAIANFRDKQYTNENSLRQFLAQFNMSEWLEEDLKTITEHLGEEFWENKDTFRVNKQKLQEIEEKMLDLLPPQEFALLLPYIRRLRYKSFKAMLKSYPEYALQLAERMGKSINPFSIEGDDIMVDTEYYHAFASSLIHVFRNMVDHGIEYRDERVMLGKNEMGSIKCSIECSNDNIRLVISDDGSGIDLEKIMEKAIASGMHSEYEIACFNAEDLNNLVFEENLSTADDITLISGRGMGLTAVKEETEKVNGVIRVKSELGAGTAYIIDLPVYKAFDLPELSVPAILSSVVKTIQNAAHNHLGISLKDDYNVIPAESIVLNRYTAMTSIRGILDGIMVMTYSEALIKRLAPLLIDFNTGDEEELWEDMAAEATNILLGNSLKLLGNMSDFITIGVPIVTSNWAARLKQPYEQIYTCTVNMDDYSVTSFFIPL